MKTIIYLRTSTEEQNPENQLEDCLAINKFGEYEVIEDKTSAWKDVDRSNFDKMKKEVMKGLISNIIVWDLDRLYRNRKKLMNFFELCKIKNVKIYSYRQSWLDDINSIPEPFNEIVHSLMLSIMGWLSEEESLKKSQRVKSAIRRRQDGIFSYKGNKWGRGQLSSFKKNKIIIFRKEGKSYREIAKELNISLGSVHKYLSKISV